jgi:hypothetical protein
MFLPGSRKGPFEAKPLAPRRWRGYYTVLVDVKGELQLIQALITRLDLVEFVIRADL